MTRSRAKTLALPRPTVPRTAALALIIAIDASIIASHQLTPYILLAQIGLLTALGVIRPWWLVGVLALGTFGYLAANFTYLVDHFGILDSLDPFNNAFTTTQPPGKPSAGKLITTQASLVLAAIVWLGSLISYVYLSRRGLARRALPVLAMAAAPFGILFAQSYGGEASLRVILFSSAWCVSLIAWAIFTVPLRRVRALLLFVTTAVMTALFVSTFFGQSGLNVVSPSEVQASEYLYAHATSESAVVLASYEFPVSYGPRYAELSRLPGDSPPVLIDAPGFRGRMLTKRDLPKVEATLNGYAHHVYLVFGPTEQTFVQIMGTSPTRMLAQLERVVASSPKFRLWYKRGGVEIYEYGRSDA